VPESYVFPSFTENKIEVAAITALAAKAPPLPAPTGAVVRVGTTEQLMGALAGAQPGTTVLLADGVYPVTERIWIKQDGICLRGESGDREKVIFDGSGGGPHDDMIVLRGAKDVLIADLTVRNCMHYGVLFYGDSDVQRLRIHNVKFHNIWTRGLKGTHPARIRDHGRNLHPPETVERIRPGGGSVRYCLFVNDTIKTFADDGFRGDYVSGMDMMGLKDWVIADNVFVGIRGKNGRGRGAIFVWQHSENVISERNVFVNCDRAICYGNPSGPALHMIRGVVRNNVIVNGRYSAIEIMSTRDTVVYNNSVWATNMRHDTVCFSREDDGARFYNNLVHGWVHCPDTLDHGHNIIGDLAGYFANPEKANLRLTPKARNAVGKGVPLAEVSEDFRGTKRPDKPTLGALEP